MQIKIASHPFGKKYQSSKTFKSLFEALDFDCLNFYMI